MYVGPSTVSNVTQNEMKKMNMIANPVLTETLKHHRSKLYYIIILLSVRKILSYLPTCAKK